jgi:threonine dehydrogenase-like Zn-dependent dehydrogenase
MASLQSHDGDASCAREEEKLMRAPVLRGGAVQARIIDDPVPGPGQLLVRSLACGICASDLHFVDHPEAGADTERRIPVGTRVSSLPVLATAGDRRIIGQNSEAPGGFGEYLLLTEAITRVVISDLPSEIVCVADAISVGWSTASRAQVTTKEVPLVIGCGAIALSAITTLKRLGMGPIVAVDFVGLNEVSAALDAARDANGPTRIVVVP